MMNDFVVKIVIGSIYTYVFPKEADVLGKTLELSHVWSHMFVKYLNFKIRSLYVRPW